MRITNLSEITSWRYNNDRRDRSNIIAETKFGYVLQLQSQRWAYIRDNGKWYRAPLAPWDDVIDFQNMKDVAITTTVTAVLSAPAKAEA